MYDSGQKMDVAMIDEVECSWNKGRSLIMARVARAGGPAAYLSMSLLPSLKVDGAYMLLNPSLNGPRLLLQFARPGESAKELG